MPAQQVLLGLAHGLILLPALLSLTGLCSQRPSRPVSPAFSSAKSVPVAQPSQLHGVDDVVDPASLRVEGSNPMFNPSKRSAGVGDDVLNAQTGRGASAEPTTTDAVPRLASP